MAPFSILKSLFGGGSAEMAEYECPECGRLREMPAGLDDVPCDECGEKAYPLD